MYANVPLYKKLALSWQIIPVYFVVIEVTYSVNHYILLNPSEISSLKKYISLFLFNPLSFMTVLTHLLSMFKSPGYVPIPFTQSPDNSKLPDLSNNNEIRSDIYCRKCQNPRPPRAHHCKVCKWIIIVIGWRIVLGIITKKIFINFYFIQLWEILLALSF